MIISNAVLSLQTSDVAIIYSKYPANNAVNTLHKIFMYAFIVILNCFKCLENVKVKKKTKSV